MYDKNISVSIGEEKIDLSEFIDKNSELLKNQYLEIIFNLSNFLINNQSLKDRLIFNGHSLWEMSSFQEKNIYKNRSIFKTIKYLALKKIITDNKENNIKVFFLENDIASILKSEFKNKKINFVKSTFSIKEKIIKILRQRKLFHFLFFSYFFFKNSLFKKYNFKFFLKKKIFDIFLFYSL